MSFAKPEWLLCLIALPLLGFVAWLSWRNRGERWKKLVAPRLLGRLSNVRPSWIHFTALGLALAGVGALIIAFAQPESGEEWIEIESEGRNILFCIDISRSMLAEDSSPSRLMASRAAALEILERFPDDRVGVLLFSGEVLVQSPLTIDHGFVEQTLAQLDPNDIPYGGSNLTGAVEAGVRLLAQTGQQSNIMVVFSDGEKSSDGLEEAATMAATEGVFIYSLGMGTTEGSFIPDARSFDGKFRDKAGNVVFSRLDEDALEILAERTEGYYSRGIGSDFLGKLDSALDEMDRFREEGKHQRVAKPAHQWFVLGGLFLIMISIYIRGLPLGSAVSLVIFFFALPQAKAGLIEDGVAAMAEGDAESAHTSFKAAAKENSGDRAASLYLAAGSAASQARDWSSAVDAFSQSVSADDPAIQQKAHYALATSLFYLGAPLEKEEKAKAWRGAIEHFEASLDLQPDHEETAANLKSVRDQLAALEKEQAKEEPKEKDQEKEENEEKDKEGEDQEEQEDSPSDDNDSDPEKEESEKQEPGEEGDPKEDENGESEDNPDDPENEGNQAGQKEEGDEGEPEESEKGEDGEPTDEKGDETDPKNEGRPNQDGDANSNQDDPKQGTGGQESEKEGENMEEPKPDPNAPPNETREERARRLLKQYADFGGKAPRRIRRPYNRSAQDW